MKNHLTFPFVVLLVMFLGLLRVDAKVVYVNAAAPVGGTGASWGTAFRSLQDGLVQSAAGDEVWVAAGTYLPDAGASMTTGDREATFTLKQDVKLYGGFAGGETNSSQRNPVTNVTILSGEISADKLYWSLHVVTFAGSATLDGFTVTKGNANGEKSPYNVGAGIYSPNVGTLAIANCTFTGNTASYGGAIYSSSSVVASNCTFTNNTASSSGGAIYSPPYSTSSSVTATNCTFTGNTAFSGGAISSFSVSFSSSVVATNCTFTNNTASSGGAIDSTSSSSSSSSVVATNCTFTNNTASSGGAIDSTSSSSSSSSSVVATNCTFTNNTASYSGGAIDSPPYSTSSSVTATNCTFTNNTASYGGAISSFSSSFSVTATNCTFTNNTASSGGAISSSSVTATNCTFTGNSSTSSSSSSSYSGGAISSSSVTATNCTFTGNSSNSSSYSGGAISSFSSVTATNCTFTGNSSNSSSYSGGAIYSSSVTATNCTFTGNSSTSSSSSSSYSGGAIYSSSTNFSYPLTLVNCTLVNNLARGTGKKGGAIFATGLVKLFNNVIWHTLAEAQDNLIYVTSTGSLRNADVDFPSPLNQAKNLIKGGMTAITSEAGAVVSLGTTSATLLIADPLFQNAGNPAGPDGIWRTADDGLRLQAASPGIGLGLALFLPVDTYDVDQDGNTTEAMPVDLTGVIRIQGAGLDLGAYEQGDSFLPIIITGQPTDVAVLFNNTASFTIAASGYDLHYQWYSGESGDVSQPIQGATGNSFTSPALAASRKYWARASNGLGFANSQTATASVLSGTGKPSAVATLSSLALSSGTLSPAFTPATASYTATVVNAVSSLTITPTLTDTTAGVKVNGSTVASGSACAPIPLSVGSNTINALVTAQDGITTKAYTVTITRAGGAYDIWKDQAFTSASDRNDPAISSPTATPARDGITNLMKYALALAPLADGSGGMPTSSRQGGYLTLTYRKSKSATDVTYTVLTGTSMDSGSWLPATTVLSQTDQGSYWLVTVRDTVAQSSSAHRFMRLKVSR